MASDKEMSSFNLKKLDIWLENDNIDGTKLTQFLSDLLRRAWFKEFSLLLEELKNEEFSRKVEQRILNAENQFLGIKHILKNAENNNSVVEVKLEGHTESKVDLPSGTDFFDLSPGLYYRNVGHGSYDAVDEFNKFFDSCYSADFKKVLMERGFLRDVNKHSQQKFRVLEGVRFHTYNHNFYTVSDKWGRYDINNSARLARLSNVNFLSSADYNIIETAIILPLEHACNNYYHNISENFGGLRFIAEFPDNVPIIYTEDRFSALDFICSRLFVKRDRFFSMRQFSEIMVKKAVLLYPANYYWDKELCDFYKKVSYPKVSCKKVYLSRRKASRGANNEEGLEDELNKFGFEVVCNEDLSFPEQVFLYSNVDILIAPHGAGLTNILYMQTGAVLIEIFKENFIVPDFYLRSRHNSIRYGCVMERGGGVDIEELLALVNSFF